MKTERSEPLETAHKVYCYTLLPHYTLASFKMTIQLCNIIYKLKETEKCNMSPFIKYTGNISLH